VSSVKSVVSHFEQTNPIQNRLVNYNPNIQISLWQTTIKWIPKNEANSNPFDTQKCRPGPQSGSSLCKTKPNSVGQASRVVLKNETNPKWLLPASHPEWNEGSHYTKQTHYQVLSIVIDELPLSAIIMRWFRTGTTKMSKVHKTMMTMVLILIIALILFSIFGAFLGSARAQVLFSCFHFLFSGSSYSFLLIFIDKLKLFFLFFFFGVTLFSFFFFFFFSLFFFFLDAADRRPWQS